MNRCGCGHPANATGLCDTCQQSRDSVALPSGYAVTLVKQTEPHGCGLACAAMLAGVSYDQAKAKAIAMGFRDVGAKYGLLPTEVLRLASELGAIVHSGIAPTAIQVRRGNRNHYIVVTSDGQVYDPA